MKKIIFLLFAVQISLSAQVEKVWSVKIPGVSGHPEMYSMRSGLLTSPSGAILLDLTQSVGSYTQKTPNLAWLTSDGKLKHLWTYSDDETPGLKPLLETIVQFNDDYILTFNRIWGGGSLIKWSVIDGKIQREETEVGEHVWFTGINESLQISMSFSLNGESFFYGVSPSSSQIKDPFITLSKYRLETKSPTFWVQQSEDLETWRDVIEVPKGETPKEFFRIAPEN